MKTTPSDSGKNSKRSTSSVVRVAVARSFPFGARNCKIFIKTLIKRILPTPPCHGNICTSENTSWSVYMTVQQILSENIEILCWVGVSIVTTLEAGQSCRGSVSWLILSVEVGMDLIIFPSLFIMTLFISCGVLYLLAWSVNMLCLLTVLGVYHLVTCASAEWEIPFKIRWISNLFGYFTLASLRRSPSYQFQVVP